MRLKRITTRDIAKQLGLHYTTVAEALRNSPRISEKTRNRVSKAAAEMGYRPDPMLSALNAYRCENRVDRRSATIAWINTDDTPDKWRSGKGFSCDCLRGAQARLAELGFKLQNFWLEKPMMSDRRASQILEARGIKGLVVAPLFPGVKTIDFEWKKFAAVRLGASFRYSKLPSVTPDYTQNMITLFRLLVRSGFKRIGMACPRWINQRVDSGYIGGFLGAHHQYQPDQEPAPMFLKDLNDHTKVEFIEWVRKHAFDALVLHRHNDYEGVLAEAGFRVPEDISLTFVSLYSAQSERFGIYENGDLIGRHGIDLTVGMLQRGEFGHDEDQADIRIRGKLIKGKTLKIPEGHVPISEDVLDGDEIYPRDALL